MAGRLEGKVAVITGGGSGIGQACAVAMAREGANIVIGDLRAANETCALVEGAGRRTVFAQTDTTDEAQCEALVAAGVEAFGRVDIGVAAAGRTSARYVTGESTDERGRDERLVVNAPLSDWTAVLDVNLIGVMQTDRALARQMIAQGGGGSIVNIASTLAKIPSAGSAPYCVSKAAVVMLTQVLALEVAPHGVRVNAVGPTYTDTPMTQSLRSNDATLHEAMARVPLGRLSRPDEVAAAVLFLASDEASFFTGETLYPSGGHYHG